MTVLPDPDIVVEYVFAQGCAFRVVYDAATPALANPRVEQVGGPPLPPAEARRLLTAAGVRRAVPLAPSAARPM